MEAMNIRKWIIRKLGGYNRDGNRLDDTDRLLSLTVRQTNAKIKETQQLQKLREAEVRLARAEEVLSEYRDEEPESEEEGESKGALDLDLNKVLSDLAYKFMQSKGIVPAQVEQQPTTENPKATLTDIQIKTHLAGLPKKHLKLIQKNSPEVVLEELKVRYPNIADQSLIRVIEIAKEM